MGAKDLSSLFEGVKGEKEEGEGNGCKGRCEDGLVGLKVFSVGKIVVNW